MVIEKSGTLEDLQEDMKQCGFHSDDTQPSLDCVMASARIDIDNALREILAKSELPLFLFDYLVTSVQADIRKADLDAIRAGCACNEVKEE